MVNSRKQSRGLNTDQVKQLRAAWSHARMIGLPLNTLISVRPFDGDNMTPAERCDLFAPIRNKLGCYARLRRFVPTFVWTREIDSDGSGEHMHVLMHIPSRLFDDFETTAARWFPRPAEMDVRPANYRVTFTTNGRRRSAIGYITKQMTPQAWYKRGVIRKPGGPILGKRGGVSANLTSKAIRKRSHQPIERQIRSAEEPGILRAPLSMF